MNKTLLTIALLASSVASQAGTLMTAENKAGGTIRLNDTTSRMCESIASSTGNRWEYAVSVSSSGDSLKGCWTYDSEMNEFEIRWTNGNTIFIPMRGMTFTNYGNKVILNK